jgi:DivIVA domain-containing protein
MELRRVRHLPSAIFLLLCGGVFLTGFRPDTVFGAVVVLGLAALAVGGGAAMLVRGLRPWRFRIGPDGLDLRLGRLRRLLGWHEIDSVILHQPAPDLGQGSGQARSPRLLLIPATGVDLGRPADVPSPVDGRLSILLLDLSDVKDKPDDVARALSTAGGGRFVDHRALLRDALPVPDFTVVLRGYDQAHVDKLIHEAREALAVESFIDRTRLAVQLRGDHPVVLRGYDREQVNAYLQALAAELAVLPGDDKRE